MDEGKSEMNQPRNEDETTFNFPIIDPTSSVHMKNISLVVVLWFQDLVSEDASISLFEFGILYHNMDYSTNT